MALARAFTSKRTKRPEISLPTPQRAMSTRNFGGNVAVRRSKISGPTELISTTNLLSFNAPDIHSASSTSSSTDDSEASPTHMASPATSVEGSTVGSRPNSPEHNHLSCYFKPPARTSSSSTATRQSSSSNDDVPRVPHRANTHTAASHQALARKRSVQRMAPPNSIHALPETSHQNEAALAHPFVQELAQVNELAEEFGVMDRVMDEEERILASKGLKKFAVDDYVSEIQSLFGGVFEDRFLPMATGWI